MARFDFSTIPFFDNHTHLLDTTNRTVPLKELLGNLAHGYGDLPNPNPFGDTCLENHDLGSERYYEDIVKSLGVSKTLLYYLSQFFNCEEDWQTVMHHRDAYTKKDTPGYIERLYRDQNVIGTMVDSALEIDDPALKCFPCKVLRLFQTDPLFYRLLASCEDYGQLVERFEGELKAALDRGFTGVKSHILEVNRQHPHFVSVEDASAHFAAAKSGDVHATEEIYYAVFCHMMLLGQQLGFYTHVHTGLTGATGNGLAHNNDPLYFCQLLNDSRFVGSRLVFLHCGYPDIRHCASMVNSYPNVWMDVAQILPWHVFDFVDILEELLGAAPHSKIMMGTGQHNFAEFVWMGAKVAKRSLETVMEHAVSRGFASEQQAQHTAEDLLYKNAARLYGLET